MSDTPCPTLLQQLTVQATRPSVTFLLGIIAASGGPQVVSLIRTVLNV